MMEFLTSIEQLSISTWIREGGDIYGYALVLFLHTMGIALVVGSTFAVNLRLLGVAPSMPLEPLLKLYPIMWYGFILNTITGVLLIMADATVKLVNPAFLVKMALIAVGLIVQRAIHRRMVSGGTDIKALAWASLVCWMGVILAGRLIAYVGIAPGLA